MLYMITEYVYSVVIISLPLGYMSQGRCILNCVDYIQYETYRCTPDKSSFLCVKITYFSTWVINVKKLCLSNNGQGTDSYLVIPHFLFILHLLEAECKKLDVLFYPTYCHFKRHYILKITYTKPINYSKRKI